MRELGKRLHSKRAHRKPLSGCSSSARFLKAFLIAAWEADPTGMPRNAHAARFSKVFKRPLACVRQSWKATTLGRQVYPGSSTSRRTGSSEVSQIKPPT